MDGTTFMLVNPRSDALAVSGAIKQEVCEDFKILQRFWNLGQRKSKKCKRTDSPNNFQPFQRSLFHKSAQKEKKALRSQFCRIKASLPWASEHRIRTWPTEAGELGLGMFGMSLPFPFTDALQAMGRRWPNPSRAARRCRRPGRLLAACKKVAGWPAGASST